ncbi:hypothetical protein FLA105535_03158 [Flavobacterium bizetiae]|nr:hypothetical protein FLA105535_03158 [Flavobacterium bizetiae]
MLGILVFKYKREHEFHELTQIALCDDFTSIKISVNS